MTQEQKIKEALEVYHTELINQHNGDSTEISIRNWNNEKCIVIIKEKLGNNFETPQRKEREILSIHHICMVNQLIENFEKVKDCNMYLILGCHKNENRIDFIDHKNISSFMQAKNYTESDIN